MDVDLARQDPFLSSRAVPRIIISRSLVAPFISDRRILLSTEKTSSFSLTRRETAPARHAVFPRVYRERVHSSWRPNLLASVIVSPFLNATTQNANDTFMNSHAIHDYETAHAFSYPTSPYCAFVRSLYAPIIATFILPSLCV